MKECPKCGRIYGDSVDTCPECQIRLNPAASGANRKNIRKPLYLLVGIAALVLVFFLGRASGGANQPGQPEEMQRQHLE